MDVATLETREATHAAIVAELSRRDGQVDLGRVRRLLALDLQLARKLYEDAGRPEKLGAVSKAHLATVELLERDGRLVAREVPAPSDDRPEWQRLLAAAAAGAALAAPSRLLEASSRASP